MEDFKPFASDKKPLVEGIKIYAGKTFIRFILIIIRVVYFREQ